jgi:signal transduction histidine kinase
VRKPALFILFLFYFVSARAQLIELAAGGVRITDSVACYMTTTDLSTLPDTTTSVSRARFLQLLNDNPRRHLFWMIVGIRNDNDSTLDCSLDYGELDDIEVWYLPDCGLTWAKRNGIVFQTAGGTLRPSPEDASYIQRQSHLLPLRLPPHCPTRLVVRIRQRTDEYSFEGLTLYDARSLNASLIGNLARDRSFLIIQMLFQGFLICQLIYALFQWLIIRRPEYGYYLLYMVLISLYFLSKQENLFGVDFLFSRWPLLKIWFGKTLLILPYYIYFRFIRSFLDIPRNYPALNRWIVPLEYFLLAYAVADLAFMFITFDRKTQTIVYTTVFAAIFLLTMGFMIYLYRHRQTLIYYIISGSLLVATGHILGLIFSYLEIDRHMDLGVPDVFVFAQAGIVLEVLCFTAGLSYKNRKTEQEKIAGQEELIEQLKANELLQVRMQHIRNKIAQDLHDDIGSTLSSISILSDLAIRGNNNSKLLKTMNEIKDSSMMLMERMDDIVWSFNPRNDSLDNLLMRIRHFATTLFEARGINYTIDIQQNISEVHLPMEYRQHIYLILKEAINNLVKYANASEATIEVRFDHRDLTLSVRDNGRGFETASATRGNGLAGMRHRAALMNARVSITSSPGAGTSISLEVELSPPTQKIL